MSDPGAPGSAGLWGSQGSLYITESQMHLGLPLTLDTEPWLAGGDCKNLNLVCL